MGVRKYLRLLLPSSDQTLSEDPTFKCLRCSAEFEREHRTCPECGGQFVGEIQDE
jgi:rRNA maturation endonuclease Nob1